jgi:hypothetical protein
MLKQRGVGVRSALLQHQWAKLEADSGSQGDADAAYVNTFVSASLPPASTNTDVRCSEGNCDKAISILRKVLDAGAVPAEALHQLLKELEGQAARATPCLPPSARPPPGSQARPSAQVVVLFGFRASIGGWNLQRLSAVLCICWCTRSLTCIFSAVLLQLILFETPAAGQRPAMAMPTPATLFPAKPSAATPGGLPVTCCTHSFCIRVAMCIAVLAITQTHLNANTETAWPPHLCLCCSQQGG